MKSGLPRRSKFYWPPAWLAGLLFTAWLAGRAEQLPAKSYTTADGLIGDGVVRVVPDGRGFIWFCTLEGLSRFDGYGFTNYTTADGLPDRHVNDLLVTRRGGYWIATEGGLVRLNPQGLPPALARRGNTNGAGNVPLFTVYQPADNPKAKLVNVLFEDEAGVVWVGTGGGLYQLAEQDGQISFHAVALGQPNTGLSQCNVLAIATDQHGALWLGTEASGLFRLLPDGRTEQYTTQHGLPTNNIKALLADRAGRLWAGTGTGGGLLLLVAEPDTSRPIVARFYAEKDGLPSSWVAALYQAADGRLWAGTTHGLCEVLLTDTGDRATFRVYAEAAGLCGDDLSAVTADRDGNLWVASARCGATKISRYGFTRYTAADGLNATEINSIFENQAGALFVSTVTAKGRVINRFDGGKFTAIRPLMPVHTSYWGWGWKQTIMQDHLGDWWIPTNNGLFRSPQPTRFEQLARTPAQAVKIDRVSGEIFRLYEDARGDIWLATTGAGKELLRWERAANIWHDYTQAAGFGPERLGTAFVEDRAGNLWIGTGGDDSALLRYRADRLTVFTHADGAPQGWYKDLYLDHAGRLWLASTVAGLVRVDAPTAPRPQFSAYTTVNGLASDNVLCVTEDQWGRIYAGTGRALDQLDPQTGGIKHYTAADGLPAGRVEVAFRDRQGALWFGTSFGLARLIPEPERPRQPPAILLTGLRVAGLARPVSALGETDIPQLELGPAETQVTVDFLGLGASLGEELRYEYKLEGTGADWTPTPTRTINFVNLAPGPYRLLVRAVSAEGAYSQTPASLAFRIAAPIWRRWWFIALAVLCAGGLAYALDRYRVARLLAVERMRTRIATDLHDDIGSGLSRVAILSEVVKQQTGATTPQAGPLLTEIAESARVLVAAMRDIVWAIDPRSDDLSSVLSRVRQFTADVLEPRKISFDFPAPPELAKVKLDPERRRHLYLIFKEAINNIARHADCASVSLRISIAHNRLTAEIRDDGRGFVAPHPRPTPTDGEAGHGLENMRHRVAQLGGQLSLDAVPGRGTCLRLTIPLSKR